MMDPCNEFRLWGPPGTGKTTTIARRIREAVDQGGPDSVLAISFTKSAALELAGRDLASIDNGMVGTLHAQCYRALGRPPIGETKLGEWNDHCSGANPEFMIAASDAKDTRAVDDPLNDQVPALSYGAQLLAEYDRARNRLTARSDYPVELARFAEDWDAWLDAHGYVDFAGMLEAGLDFETAPGAPDMIFLDEAQDSSALQLAVVRRWARKAQKLILAGDPNQTLYEWIGASPEAFLNPPIPPQNEHVLGTVESYRLPPAIHTYSQDWLARINSARRFEFAPRRGPDGAVEHMDSDVNLAHPERLLAAVDIHLERGETVMLLATCSYFLDTILHTLRQRGYPFSNRWRRARHDWNPLFSARGVSTSERILAYLRPDVATWGDRARMWNYDDLRDWVALLRAAGVLKRGGKAKLESIGADLSRIEVTWTWLLENLLEPEAATAVLDTDLAWLRAHMLPDKACVAEYPLQIIASRGGQALREEPRLTVGTVHSVKGAEADAVFLFPDLSRAAYDQYCASPSDKDAVLRVFYVGITRAKQALHLCAPSTPLFVKF